ncbi:O-antigen ligase family protein [Azospirillum sp. A39]|uniref:O-antigen ligase family protein n=1 Tax=Azospirillum sp. A39 TaxID=3462279 RepID=UPI0040460BF3
MGGGVLAPFIAWRDKLAAVAFAALFVPLFVLDEAAARIIGYLGLATAVATAWDRRLLGQVLRSPPLLAVAAYLGFVLVSVSWSGRPSLQIIEFTGRYLNVLSFVAATALLAHTVPLSRSLAELAFVVAAAMAALVAIFCTLATVNGGGRLTGFGASANSVVAAILYGAALLVLVFRLWPATVRTLGCLLLAAAGVVLVLALILTKSRGPMVATAATLGLGLMMQGRDGRRAALALLVVGAAGLLATIGVEGVLERGFSYRLEIWRQVLEQVAAAPWFGTGSAAAASFRTTVGFEALFAHSILFSALLTTGVFGLVLLLVMVGVLGVHAVRVAGRGDPLPLALLVFTMAYGLVDRQLDLRNLSPEYLTIWYAAGLLAAASTPADNVSAPPSA